MDEIKKPGSRQEEIHLLDYLIVLAKRSRLIVFGTLGIMVLTYLFLLLIVPVKYTATVHLLPPHQNLTLSGQLLDSMGVSSVPRGGVGGLGGLAAGLLGVKNPNEIYVGILSGTTIADRIIARFNLRELYKQKYIEDIRKTLSKNTNLEAKDDGLILIEVTDTDPQRAAAMANAFAEELDKLLQEIAHQDAKNQLAFLEQERSQVLANLTKAEEELRAFSEKSGVVQLDAQARGMIAYVANLRAEIDAKEVQIQVLKKQATPHNFDVIRLQTEVSSLKEKLKEAERQVDQACLGEVCLPTANFPGLGLQYLRLLREVKYQNTLYEAMNKMAELARLDVARNSALTQIHYVDRAIPPEKKSKPQRVLITALVGFVTFLLLITSAFGLEYWQKAVREAENAPRLEQMRRHLGEWKALKQEIYKIFKSKTRTRV